MLFDWRRVKPSTDEPATFCEVIVIPADATSRAEYAELIIEMLFTPTLFLLIEFYSHPKNPTL
jgi:hypothetical protein